MVFYMHIKVIFSEMNQKLEQLSKLLMKKEGILDQDIENELEMLTEQSSEIAEEWLKFEEKLGDLLVQQKFQTNKNESEEWKKGKALYDLFMFDKAIPYIEKVVNEHPEFETARLYLAHAYLEVKQYEKARYCLQFLIETTEKENILNLSFHTLGCMEGILKDHLKAIHYFKKIDINKIKKEWKPTYVFNYALSLFQEKKYEACLEKLIEYYQLESKDWQGPYMLGKVYLALGDEEAGIAFWFEALQLQENIKLLKEMAKHFEQKTYYQMAAQCYQRVLKEKSFSMDKEAWFGLAWNYGLAHQMQKSEEKYLKALSLFPNDMELQISYAWMLLLWNKKPKAQKMISGLAYKYPEDLLVQGLPFLYEGKYKQALQILTSV